MPAARGPEPGAEGPRSCGAATTARWLSWNSRWMRAPRSAISGSAGAASRIVAAQPRGAERAQQSRLGAEGQVDRPRRDPGLAGHLGHRGGGVALAGGPPEGADADPADAASLLSGAPTARIVEEVLSERAPG